MSEPGRNQNSFSGDIEDPKAQTGDTQEVVPADRKSEAAAIASFSLPGEEVSTLPRAEQSYRVFVESMVEGAVTLLPDGAISFCNSRFSEMVGFPVRRCPGTCFERFLAPEQVPLFRSLLESCGRDGKDAEFTIVASDGRQMPARISMRRLADRPGCELCLVVTDLSKQKQAEQARAFLAAIVDSSEDAIVGTTLEGIIVSWNRAAERLYGYTAEEMAGRHVALLVPDHNPSEVNRILASIKRGESVEHYETQRLRKDGGLLDVALTVSPVRDPSGMLTGTSAIYRDISERNRAEREHRRLMAAIEQLAEAVVITDVEGAIEYVNPAFTAITGYSRGEALGRNPRILKSGKQDAQFYKNVWDTILEGNVWRGDLINRRKEGTFYSAETSITPVRDERGRISHFISVTQDVTERKRLEAQLRQSQKMEAVGRLAGGVAHDFNNLLTVISGRSSIVAEGLAPSDPTRASLEEVIKAADRAASLTRQLLAFSRQQVLQPRVLDLNEVVVNIEKLLRRLIGEDISLITAFDVHLGRIKADPGQMEQVLMNLAVNARDAMPKGGQLTIETRRILLGDNSSEARLNVPPGPYALLSVTDMGVGMDEQTRLRIFEPFFTTKDPGKGTGLGLSTVYGIVRQSGGHISVRSEPGQGATFEVYLPEADSKERERRSCARDCPAG